MSGVHVRGSILGNIIFNAYYNYGFVSAFVYGSQGVGKTTYALKVMYNVYGDWDEVLGNTYFYVDDLIPRLHRCADEGKRIRCILLDDAGVWLIKYRWSERFSVWFCQLFNLIRTVCAGVIFTSVEVSDIVRFIRDKVIYRVSIRVPENPRDELDREAIGYRVFVTPTLQHWVKKVFIDRFTLRLPDDVRERYNEMRKEAIKRLMGELRGRGSRALPDVGVDVGGLVSEI